MASKVYIAASSTEIDRADEFMHRCRLAGWYVTHDWPSVIALNGGVANPNDVHAEIAAQWSLSDLRGVDEAGVFVLLAPLDGAPARGAFFEFGYAVAQNKPTLLVRSSACTSIFQAMATFEVASDGEAHEMLGRWIRKAA